MKPHLTPLGKVFLVFVFLMVAVGLVVLSSAGLVDAQRKFGSGYYYLTHQLLYGVLPGLALFFICSKIPYKYWRTFAMPILLAAIVGMILVFVPQVGLGLKGARRWLVIAGTSVQPSEFLKLGLIMYLAAWFSSRSKTLGNVSYAIVPMVLIISFVSILLVLQPDFGTLGITLLISLTLYFFAGARLKHLGLIFLVFFVALLGLSIVSPYRYNRIKAFMNRSQDTQGVAYHINQALVGIGSGGLPGLGFGKSIQKQNNLPEPVNDSIFAIIVEETGLIGGGIVIGLFTGLALVLFLMARSVSEPFAQLFVLGMGVWIFGQTTINLAAITGIIPFTGLPLPFISYGSSALVSLLTGLGVVANIAKEG